VPRHNGATRKITSPSHRRRRARYLAAEMKTATARTTGAQNQRLSWAMDVPSATSNHQQGENTR
jgi:hypothetical protein